MFDFSNRLVRIILIYLLSVPIIIFLGLLNENLGHALLFISSAFLSVGILYEIWKGYQPLREVKYPSPKEIPRFRTLENLGDIIGKATGGHGGAFTVLMSRLRHTYVERILGPEYSRGIDVEDFLIGQKGSSVSRGDAELVSLLLTKEPDTQEGRLELLHEILERLED